MSRRSQELSKVIIQKGRKMNEEINHLLGYNDMKIIQIRDMFTFSLDTVFREEPLDPSLEDFDDSKSW